jgi:hypothetical protein
VKILKYFGPLGTFIVGMIFTLGMTIFFPAIFSAQQGLEANAAVQSGAYWGLQAVITSTRLVIFMICLMLTLVAVGMSWLARKN